MILAIFLKLFCVFLIIALTIHALMTTINKRCMRNFLPPTILELTIQFNILAIFAVVDSQFLHYVPILHEYLLSFL